MTTSVADRISPHRASLTAVLSPVALLLGVTLAVAPQASAADPMIEFRGPTMGTTYMVKLFSEAGFDRGDPGQKKELEELRFAVDAELRSVNDQMSTYLESSEISRFNASDSTDWFPVSRETATVVQFAQQVAAATDGSFDVTVAPLVDAWSFGSADRTYEAPDQKTLDKLRTAVDYTKLSVRVDPPALKKEIPSLQVDLSAIAKGHGVDRVVDLVTASGYPNTFVEIGGEVRTAGDKGGEPWTVGIQRPDSATGAVMIAHPLTDKAMATSGDYRNQFESDGVTYSHTIDPKTGAPVEKPMASVSVIASDCMTADAWATAVTALGPEAGLAAAQQQNLDALLVSRSGEQYDLAGTGDLAEYAPQDGALATPRDGQQADESSFLQRLAPVLALSGIAFALVLTAMAVGVLFGRKSISGSCGGLNAPPGVDPGSNCTLCGNSTEGCQELRDKIRAESGEGARERADSLS